MHSDRNRCIKNIHKGQLPYRTALLLKREEDGFSEMVAALHTSGKGSEPSPDLQLMLSDLEAGLNSSQPLAAYASAFLLGRVKGASQEVEAKLDSLLEKLLKTSEAADVKIEAAMSLALRGKVATGQKELLKLLYSPDPFGDQYKASFYLAQMGNLAGYQKMLETLTDEIPHYRLMAIRHLIAFWPFEGQMVGNDRVSIHALILQAAMDKSELVRVEIPFYLEILGLPNLAQELEAILAQEKDAAVRAAIALVLERNQ
ncbi:MAG TPA: hypothetical protein ENJ82_17065 [Bacteroidetes bacterium]|nr:hypothetical protein [Bacteroidota bacterium]